MNNFPLVFGTIVVTVVVGALLYDHATPHVTASVVPPTSRVTESKTLPANIASANASESIATTAVDAGTPRNEGTR